MAEDINNIISKLSNKNIFSADIGTAGTEFARLTPTKMVDTSGQVAAVAGAVKDAADKNIGSMQLNDAAQGINYLAEVYPKKIEQEYIDKQQVSLSAQLDAVKKGLQLENVQGAFTTSALNDPNIHAAYDELQAVKALRDQGYANNIAVQLRAEAILKKYINQAPAFSNEMRKIAYETVGFDPTGAQLQALMGTGTKAALSPEQKGRESAAEEYEKSVQLVMLKQGATREQAQKQIMQQESDRLLTDSLNLRMKLGDVQISENKVLTNEIVGELDRTGINSVLAIPDPKNPQSGETLFGGVMKLYATQGGLREDQKRDFVGAIELDKQRFINATLARLPDTTSLEDRDRVQKHIQDRFKQLETIVTSGDLEKIFKSKLERMTDAEKLEIIKNPAMLTVYALSGSGGVINNIDVLNQWARLDPETVKKLAPGAGFILDRTRTNRIASETLIANAKGDVPAYSDPQDKYISAQTGLMSLVSKDLTDDQKLVAFKTGIANQSKMNVLSWFASMNGEQAVRGSKTIKSQFQNLFTGELNGTVNELRAQIQEFESKGTKIIIDPQTGVISTDKPLKFSYDINKPTETGWYDFAFSPAFKSLQTIFKVVDRQFDALGIKDTAGYKKELIGEILAPSGKVANEGVNKPITIKDTGEGYIEVG